MPGKIIWQACVAMKKEQDIAGSRLCPGVLLSTPAWWRGNLGDSSGNNFIDSLVCTASVNDDNFSLNVVLSHLSEQAIKTGADIVLLIQRWYNN